MTFHVVSLPHTQTTMEYEACAYTSKTRKFCNMMKSLGHKVYLYASEENEANVDELITITTSKGEVKTLKITDKTKITKKTETLNKDSLTKGAKVTIFTTGEGDSLSATRIVVR